jgi:4-aminobutyrate aminotransferase
LRTFREASGVPLKNYVLPGPKAAAILEKQAKYLSLSTAAPLPIVWEHAADSVVTDVDGNEFIDFSSGVLVTNTGHCHPRIVKAIQDQASRLINCYDFAHPLRAEFAEKVAGLLPQDLKSVLILSSGSEAIDAAIKIARFATGKDEVISFDGAFHGRTFMAMSVSGLEGAKGGFGPLVPGVLRVPFPDYYHAEDGEGRDRVDEGCLEALEEVLRHRSPHDICALIAEPYQGARGSLVPSGHFMRELRAFCDRHGILLILDEVQSSFGRTGKLFAFQHFDIVPDILVLGKGIASGMPMAAVVARTSITAGLKPGSFSSTYGGNPIACAAGIASIDVVLDEGLPDRSAAIGRIMKGRLEEMKDRHRSIGDVRGLGLALAMELVKERKTREPNTEMAQRFAKELLRGGVCVMAPIGRYGNVLRISPPLTISEEKALEGLDAVEATLQRF